MQAMTHGTGEHIFTATAESDRTLMLNVVRAVIAKSSLKSTGKLSLFAKLRRKLSPRSRVNFLRSKN